MMLLLFIVVAFASFSKKNLLMFFLQLLCKCSYFKHVLVRTGVITFFPKRTVRNGTEMFNQSFGIVGTVMTKIFITAVIYFVVVATTLMNLCLHKTGDIILMFQLAFICIQDPMLLAKCRGFLANHTYIFLANHTYIFDLNSRTINHF